MNTLISIGAAVTIAFYGFVTPQSNLRVGQKLELPGVVCDTREQAESILKAHQSGGVKAGQEQFLKLRTGVNSDGEPPCVFRADWLVKVTSQLQVYSGLSFDEQKGSSDLYLLAVDMGFGSYVMISQVGVQPPD